MRPKSRSPLTILIGEQQRHRHSRGACFRCRSNVLKAVFERPPIDPKASRVESAGFRMALRIDLAPRVKVGSAQRVGERIVLPYPGKRVCQALGGNVHVPVGDGGPRRTGTA